ncbi:MAG: FdhF/YdeP family oxidoreductase [Crocinitomicaceae bacterium]|nr:FdhF/YdeP family oxidoreductase [Crocinitomicaceae bacterium]
MLKDSFKYSGQPPKKFTEISLTDPKRYAAGIPAIISSLNFIKKEVGVANGIKLLKSMNQMGGFDCPGCAWPDPDDKRALLSEYCENGAKAISEEYAKAKAGPDFFSTHTVSDLLEWSDLDLGKAGRLTHPMVFNSHTDKYEEISWEDAFLLIAKELKSLKTPNEAVFYTSGRTSNEAAFLYQLMVRRFGTNNLPDCSNMCHESSGTALSETLGIGKGSVTLDDFNHAELVVVIGQNPGTNHPRMLSALRNTKDNGGSIICINPLPEAGLIAFKDPQKPLEWIGKGTNLSDLYLPVRINGDLPLIKAILVLVYEKEKTNPGSQFDWDFINDQTQGIDLLLNNLKEQDFNFLVKESGVDESLIREAAELISKKSKIIICWAMGLTQQKNAVANIQELVNLLLLKGSIAKKGAGTCPVRGHSNVQGDRTMGIWEKPPEFLIKNLKEEFHFDPPTEHGYDVVEAIKAMHENKAKVFIGMGGNFISATPDTIFTAEALQKCDLTVHVSTKPNRSHLIHGKQALILPVLGRLEEDLQKSGHQFVTVENSMGVVHSSKGNMPPVSKHVISEPELICRLSCVLLEDDSINWLDFKDDYALIRDKIEAVIPGFKSYNKRVKNPSGFYLPNNARSGDFTKTKTGKANFTTHTVEPLNLTEGQLLMMTIRTHDQYNTTIYGLNDRYRGVYNERRVIFMNEGDMLEYGFENLDIVDIKSHFNGEERLAEKFKVVKYPIPPKCCATYFPETNVLVPIGSVADKSNTPTSKFIKITLTRHVR